MGFLLSPQVDFLPPIVLCPPGVFLRAKAEKAKVCCTPLPLRLFQLKLDVSLRDGDPTMFGKSTFAQSATE
jgi:hypothetical protein